MWIHKRRTQIKEWERKGEETNEDVFREKNIKINKMSSIREEVYI